MAPPLAEARKSKDHIFFVSHLVTPVTLMPAFFSLALAPALRDLQPEFRPNEQALAYLDDVYILATPDRVAFLYRRLEELMWQWVRPRLNASKTRQLAIPAPV